MSRNSKTTSSVPSVLWRRPGRFVAIAVGAVAAILGEVLHGRGIGHMHLETAFTALLLLWALLAAFRPEWRRLRYWFAIFAAMVGHVILWVFIEQRTGHLGFFPMFGLVVAEFLLVITVIALLIPEDAQDMLDYIRRW
jgi:hypothetical protein